jgi:hypothetical protein
LYISDPSVVEIVYYQSTINNRNKCNENKKRYPDTAMNVKPEEIEFMDLTGDDDGSGEKKISSSTSKIITMYVAS